MKVVVDTNILVSGLLNSLGTSGEIVRWIADERIRLCHNEAILEEYDDVLHRPRFDFDPAQVEELLAQIRGGGEAVEAGRLAAPLPDRDDEVFLAVALAAGCEYLVTGNARHFPAGKYGGVEIISPAAFVATVRELL